MGPNVKRVEGPHKFKLQEVKMAKVCNACGEKTAEASKIDEKYVVVCTNAKACAKDGAKIMFFTPQDTAEAAWAQAFREGWARPR